MKAVGLVTFWDNNYGSALQCYSLKKVISSFGYRCDLIEEKHTGKKERYTRILKKCIHIPCKSLRYPQFWKAYMELRRHAKIASVALSEKSRQDIHFFGITELKPIELSKKGLKRIGHSDDYIAFITGSDQVWGGHFVEPTYGNFLEFAPNDKRISYAASFGSNTISNYNRLKYKRGIEGIDKLSVREDSGIKIIKDLTGKDAVKMPDPTILLTTDEWLQFADGVPVESEPYILAHFLDKASVEAVHTIRVLAEANNMKIICLGWKRDEILSLDNVVFEDGGPKEYISLINHAAYVCTDSFHTTLFSLRLKKQFYTFPRSYAHRFHQTGRVTNLLSDAGCSERYIKQAVTSFDELPHKEVDSTNFFDTQRNVGLNFLGDVIPQRSTYELPRLKEDNECSGCGVCAEKCPANAIKMEYSGGGYCLPVIDKSVCISCRVCEKVCVKSVEIKRCTKMAYIAYSNDSILLDRSASGGVFSALAKQFILNNGVVYGAALKHDESKLYVEHCCATTLDELYPLLQSKYVQSNAVTCFEDIQNRLSKAQPVLFGGTSCQVNALLRYLDKKYDNLFTIDLVCHGVPGAKFFSDYIEYLEQKNKSKVTDFSFREKVNGEISYVQRVRYENGKTILTQVDNSDYYRLFFSMDSYRESCYHCEYASVDKPADLTVGDYFECRKDYPELFIGKDSLEKVNGLSCCIIHNEKGQRLLDIYGGNLTLIKADLVKVQRSHNNLCFPSKPTDRRERIVNLYMRGGFKKIHSYHRRMDMIFFVPNLCKRIIKKVIGQRLR